MKALATQGLETESILRRAIREQAGDVEAMLDQLGLEVYWKALVSPNLWITPGLQLAFDPVNNPSEDLIAVPLIKFRMFL